MALTQKQRQKPILEVCRGFPEKATFSMGVLAVQTFHQVSLVRGSHIED